MAHMAKIGKWGTSFGVRLPSEIVDEMRLASGDRLMISVVGDELVGRRVAADELTTEDLFAGYAPGELADAYAEQAAEFDWGPDVGAEIVPPYGAEGEPRGTGPGDEDLAAKITDVLSALRAGRATIHPVPEADEGPGRQRRRGAPRR